MGRLATSVFCHSLLGHLGGWLRGGLRGGKLGGVPQTPSPSLGRQQGVEAGGRWLGQGPWGGRGLRGSLRDSRATVAGCQQPSGQGTQGEGAQHTAHQHWHRHRRCSPRLGLTHPCRSTHQPAMCVGDPDPNLDPPRGSLLVPGVPPPRVLFLSLGSLLVLGSFLHPWGPSPIPRAAAGLWDPCPIPGNPLLPLGVPSWSLGSPSSPGSLLVPGVPQPLGSFSHPRSLLVPGFLLYPSLVPRVPPNGCPGGTDGVSLTMGQVPVTVPRSRCICESRVGSGQATHVAWDHLCLPPLSSTSSGVTCIHL